MNVFDNLPNGSSSEESEDDNPLSEDTVTDEDWMEEHRVQRDVPNLEARWTSQESLGCLCPSNKKASMLALWTHPRQAELAAEGEASLREGTQGQHPPKVEDPSDRMGGRPRTN